MNRETSKKPILHDTDGAAAILENSPGTLAVWRCRGIGPPYIRVGRSIRYDEQDLIEYLEKQKVRPEQQLAEAR